MLSFLNFNAQEAIPSNPLIIGGSFNFLSQSNTFPITGISSGIGGIGLIFSNNINDTQNSNFGFSPYVGKQLFKSWLIGISLDFRYGNYSAEDIRILNQLDPVDFERIFHQYGLGLLARHLINPQNKFQIFIQTHIDYNLLDETEKINNVSSQEEEASFFEFGIVPGVIYNISNKINLTTRFGGLSYVNGSWEIKDSDTSKNFNSFSLNLGTTNIYFGFEIKFN
jgi:hypothetical protein